jgi:hypothetical protein
MKRTNGIKIYLLYKKLKYLLKTLKASSYEENKWNQNLFINLLSQTKILKFDKEKRI